MQYHQVLDMARFRYGVLRLHNEIECLILDAAHSAARFDVLSAMPKPVNEGLRDALLR